MRIWHLMAASLVAALVSTFVRFPAEGVALLQTSLAIVSWSAVGGFGLLMAVRALRETPRFAEPLAREFRLSVICMYIFINFILIWAMVCGIFFFRLMI